MESATSAMMDCSMGKRKTPTINKLSAAKNKPVADLRIPLANFRPMPNVKPTAAAAAAWVAY